jgi:outer membrane receptor protein involved in Fe transport
MEGKMKNVIRSENVRNISIQRRNSRCALLLVGAAALSLTAHSAKAQAQSTTAITPEFEEITVTATRRSEDIQRVPITITAYTQAQMDEQGIKSIDDLARLTPDIQFTHTTGSAGNNISDISIRGIYSDVGAATTGIYIDDTPVQTRNIGYFSANPYPKIFDLDRVEVLSGPQGTLFGAGAEGGAVRFITPQPSLTNYTGYFRSEVADTENGDPSYEAGLAVGGPIVQDKVGFRISGWARNDGGYIDHLSPATGALIQPNANYDISSVGTVAFILQPIDGLKITPSIYYQNIYAHDRDQYWNTLSNPNSDKFAQAARIGQPSRDQFGLPALKIEYDLNAFSIVSNTSYFARQQTETLDYSDYLGGLIYGSIGPLVHGDPFFYGPQDVPSVVGLDINQRNITQELRVQSNDKNAFIVWTAGAFYSWDKQSEQSLFGNGQSFFQGELINGILGQRQWIDGYDEQVSGYGNIDVNLYDGLKLTAGVRVSNTKYNYVYNADGIINGGVTHRSGAQQETPVTPKFGISYQIDPANFIYATASKGFRPGGAQQSVPQSFCGKDLTTLGLTNGSPATYNSDSVWSYEAGAKDAFFDGRLRVDASAYYIDWSGIQQNVRLPTCGFTYVSNLGSATSTGGDLQVRLLVTDALSVGGSAGYNSTTIDQTNKGGSSAILFEQGDRIGGSPLNVAAWAQYNFKVLGDLDAYSRLDYTFHSRTPSVDPRTFGYDAGIPAAGAVSSVSLRVGVTFDDWNISAFADNISNSEQFLSKSHDIPGSPLYYNLSYRPPTAGVTAVYRFGGPKAPEAAPAAYVPPPVVAPKPSVAKSYMVFFDFNKSDLTPQAVAIVGQAAKNAAVAKVTQLTVTGHTDTVGSDAYNMRLSRRRAESVAAELEKDGIPSSEIEIVAKGKKDLLVPTADGVKEPQNRRVQIVYSGGPMS